ncbi:MAG: helix-turn-helix transcriptional regulator [Raoultibacter sp.]
MDYRLMGQKIRKRRRELSLTQEQLAEAIDVSASFVGHIERGTKKASLETLEKLCVALNISMDSVAMPVDFEPFGIVYSAKHLQKAHALLETALEMCK